MSACIFHPVPPPLEMLRDTHTKAHLGVMTPRLQEGENTCLTCCRRGLKRESRSPHAELPIITERLWQSNGRPFRDICVCVCYWRAVNATLQNRCVWLTKPSEINSRNRENLLKLEKMCVTSFLMMGYVRLLQKPQWRICSGLFCGRCTVTSQKYWIYLFVCLTWAFLCSPYYRSHEGQDDFFKKMYYYYYNVGYTWKKYNNLCTLKNEFWIFYTFFLSLNYFKKNKPLVSTSTKLGALWFCFISIYLLFFYYYYSLFLYTIYEF